MIIYFANRTMDILGSASTNLPEGLTILDDNKTEEIETGVAIFEYRIPYDAGTLEEVETCTEAGNYILRSDNGENEFYTIIETEKDTKNQEIYIYAEDAGMDLLNEVFGAYEADKAYPISHYINKYANDTGFVIGINEVENLTRKLSWDGEDTAAARIASVATQFDNCNVSYSFDVQGLKITNKYINIYKKRGKDIRIQLRLNKDIDRIITTKSVAELATSLEVTGGTPENSENPITLKGYKYDDGDIYVSGTRLNSREALKRWSRYVWEEEPNQQPGYTGHIVAQYSYDTTSQSELCNRAVSKLKEISDVAVNYEVELSRLPDNVRIGDTMYIVDEQGKLYLSSRILKLEISRCNQKQTATLGEYLIKSGGIAQKVADLAAEFAKTSASAARAKAIASEAKAVAEDAQTQADEALSEATDAQATAGEAQQIAQTAKQSAEEAQDAADDAQIAVGVVEKSVESLQVTVTEAQQSADNAWEAAKTADEKADEASQAAQNAVEDAADAKTAADTAQSTADTARTTAEEAIDTASTAEEHAATAKTTAEAAKKDAQDAQDEIDALGENLTTLSNTMQADYARKTDLTEAEASLQTQISQNAAQLKLTASKVEEIDETANDAAEKAQAAQTAAAAAQTKADQASAEATAAQTAADEAALAATNAQNEADTAKKAAQTAQSVADQAEKNLADAKADLATVTSRVDATEEEIEAAQAAVDTAQAAADKAKADAQAAVTSATAAQTKADQAAENAEDAQAVANDAASKANAAQLVANEAKGDAQSAQEVAEAAQAVASAAQNTANTAKSTAQAAQTVANTAAQTAAEAQTAADEADKKAAQAAADLATAQKNLSDVTSRVDATEEEVEAAQEAVQIAQAAADKAKADAVTAQSTADTAKKNAQTAQQAANTAQAAADAAQTAADSAQAAADAAQDAVDALAVRVTNAETNITQNAELIGLAATKEEVTKTLGGYYTKEEADAAIQISADGINTTVSKVQSTAEEALSGIENADERVTEAESAISQLAESIAALITDENGGSLMTQTSGGWRFDISYIVNALNDAKEILDSQAGSISGINSAVSKYDQLIDDITKKTAYIIMTTDNDGNPCVELGKEDDPFKVQITNTAMNFMDSGVRVAYISNRTLYIEKVIIKDDLQIGDIKGFTFKRRSNGNMGLRWIEGGD